MLLGYFFGMYLFLTALLFGNPFMAPITPIPLAGACFAVCMGGYHMLPRRPQIIINIALCTLMLVVISTVPGYILLACCKIIPAYGIAEGMARMCQDDLIAKVCIITLFGMCTGLIYIVAIPKLVWAGGIKLLRQLKEQELKQQNAQTESVV